MSTSEYSPSTESGASTVDADAVARAKREIQGLIQEIAELSRTDVSPDQFYDGLLNRVVAALSAPGGAVWQMTDAGALQLVYQINLRETGLLESEVGQQQHARLLADVLRGTEGALVAPHSGEGGATDDDPAAAANPTEFLLVLGPVHNDLGAQGVIEIFQRAGARPNVQRGYLRFLLQACELAGDFLRGRRLQHLSEKQSLWEQLESFTRLAHDKLEVRQTAFTVANEGRRLIGCDRVSVAIQRGRKCPVEAVSGQDQPDKRSNTMVMLGKLARAVTRTGEDVWYTGDTANLAPQVEKALDAYVDESHTKAMAILPLFEPRDEEDLRTEKQPPKVLGALIVEQMVDSRPPEGFTQRVDVVRGHSASALNNAITHESLFLLPVWRALGKATGFFRGRTLPKTLAVIGSIAAFILAGCLVPYDFAMHGDGQLRPIRRANVYASLTGEIRQVLVKHEQLVRAGDLVIVQESKDLEREIKQIEGDLEETRTQILSTKLDNEDSREAYERDNQEQAANIAALRVRQRNLEQQRALITDKAQRLNIHAPIDGQVITWELEENWLGRTAQPGTEIMTIADPSGPWELEVLMPETKMRHVEQAWHRAQKSGEPLTVSFILATHPSDDLTGQVVEIHRTAEPRGETGNTVLLRVEFDQQALRDVVPNPNVNASATAKVHCGRQPIGYVLFHSLFDAFKRHVLFPFG